MRLDRYISNATGISRTLVHRLIKSGSVLVDGAKPKNVGFQLEPKQCVTLDGEEVIPAEHLYLMLHKPQGTVCANTDNQHPTVIDLLDGAEAALHPTEPLQVVGRLDMDTTGLVLLTTDGQWNHKITAPNSHCTKTYTVQLAETINDESIALLEAGIVLKSETKTTLPCKIQRLNDTNVIIELSEGKYHQVKRMFAAVGNKVVQLHRKQIGNIGLPDDLELGQFRALTADEIQQI